MGQNCVEDGGVLDYVLVRPEESVVVEAIHHSSAMEARMVSVEVTIDLEHGVVDLLPNSLASSDKNYGIAVLEMHVAPNFISWHYASLEVPSNVINPKAISLAGLLGSSVRMGDWLLRHVVLVLVASGGSISMTIYSEQKGLMEVPTNEEGNFPKGSNESVVQANVVGFIASETILRVADNDLAAT